MLFSKISTVEGREALVTALAACFTVRVAVPRDRSERELPKVTAQNYDPERARTARMSAYEAARDEILACRHYHTDMMPNGRLAAGVKRQQACEAHGEWSRLARSTGEWFKAAYAVAHPSHRQILSHIHKIFVELMKAGLLQGSPEEAFAAACAASETLFAAYAQ